jgi:hypothetical protein
MPNWQPNWNDVRWDWGAASDAARALRQTADRLDDITAQRLRLAGEAQLEWRGRHRLRFDGELSALVRQARDLAGELRRKASEIDRQSSRARDEQRHRERERERWRRERDEERRRAERHES